MVGPLATSALVGLGVMVAHGGAHYIAGNPDDFEDAGVSAAGITVAAAAATATYTVLTLGGVA